MSNICPCCGYNIEADSPIEAGSWRIDPRGGVYFGSSPVTFRNSWVQIMHTVASFRGSFVPTGTLQARITEKEDLNLIASQVSSLKKHLRANDFPVPITSHRTRGYRWAV